jgi:hypothetical protein
MSWVGPHVGDPMFEGMKLDHQAADEHRLSRQPLDEIADRGPESEGLSGGTERTPRRRRAGHQSGTSIGSHRARPVPRRHPARSSRRVPGHRAPNRRPAGARVACRCLRRGSSRPQSPRISAPRRDDPRCDAEASRRRNHRPRPAEQRRTARDRPNCAPCRVLSKTAMKTQTITLERWRRGAPDRRAKSALIVARLGSIERDKPRDPTEAEFLRRIGTPERLIGPSA